MSVIYSEKELLSVFDKVNVMNEEIGEVEYIIFSEENMSLRLYLLPLEEYASITLTHNDGQTSLFDVGVENLERLVLDNGVLQFYKSGVFQNPALTITIRPKISLWCRAATPKSG